MNKLKHRAANIEETAKTKIIRKERKPDSVRNHKLCQIIRRVEGNWLFERSLKFLVLK